MTTRAVAISLDAILTQGLTVGGHAAESITVRLVGGGLVSIDLPRVVVQTPVPSPSRVGEPTSNTQRRILLTLSRSALPMTRKNIAAAMGLEQPSGRFGRACLELVSAGLMVSVESECSLSEDGQRWAAANKPSCKKTEI